MNIIEKIDKLRIERGWSMYKLAEECMLTQSTISNMFIRKTNPSIATLEALCMGLGISMSDFFKEDEEKINADAEFIRQFNKLSEDEKDAVLLIMKRLSKK